MRRADGQGRGGSLEWLAALAVAALLGAGGWLGWQKLGNRIEAPARAVPAPQAAGAPVTSAGRQPAATEERPLESDSSPAGPASADPAKDPVPPAAEMPAEASVREVPLPEILPEGPPATPRPQPRFEDLPAPVADPLWPGNELAAAESGKGLLVEGEPVEVAAGRLLVVLQPDATEQEFLDAVGRGGARPKVLGRVPALKLLVVDAAGGDLRERRQKWAEQETVRAMYHDELLQAAAGDPALASRDTSDDWQLRSMGLPQAWDKTLGDPRTVLALLDEAPDAAHPELQGKIVSTWSVIDGGALAKGGRGEHATAMAILAVGRIDNGFGAAGAAPGARLMPIEVARSGRTSLSAVLAGVDRAVAHGADVILVPYEPAWTAGLLEAWRDAARRPAAEKALAEWQKRGSALAAVLGQRLVEGAVVLVLPAGNRGVSPDYLPWGTAAGVLVVGAAGPDGLRSAESSEGRVVKLLGPGVGVPVALQADRPAGFELRSGTSYAAACAAGVCALLRSAAPGLGAARIRALLERTERRPGAGAGMVSAERMQQALAERPAVCGNGSGLLGELTDRLLREDGAGAELAAQLVEAVEEAAGEMKGRGTEVLAKDLGEAQAVLISSQSGKSLGAGLLRGGTWYLLYQDGTRLRMLGATSRWQGRLPRRDVRAFEVDAATLAPLRGVFFAEPLGEVEPGPVQRWSAEGMGQESLAQTGLCPKGVLEAMRRGETLAVPVGKGRVSKFRPGGSILLRFELNGRPVERSGMQIDVVVDGGGGKEVAVLRYGVLDEERWPILITVEGPRRGVAAKPLRVFGLRCF